MRAVGATVTGEVRVVGFVGVVDKEFLSGLHPPFGKEGYFAAPKIPGRQVDLNRKQVGVAVVVDKTREIAFVLPIDFSGERGGPASRHRMAD